MLVHVAQRPQIKRLLHSDQITQVTLINGGLAQGGRTLTSMGQTLKDW